MIKTAYLSLCLIGFASILSASLYLQFDNTSPATLEDLLEDPFLVLRTKGQDPTKNMDWADSYLRWAQLNSLDTPSATCNLVSKARDDALAFSKVPDLTVSLIHPADTFDHCKPHFYIKVKGDAPYSKLWWQVSPKPDFSTIPSNLEEICPYTSLVILSDLAETFLNPHQFYYFRARVDASDWSEPHPFQVNKPSAIQNIDFSKISSDTYRISWQKDASETIEYLVFGSNAFDFIPSLYIDKQIEAIYQEKIIKDKPNFNCIAITKEPYIDIDGSYAYYRIVARDREQLSVPSSLIYVYDSQLNYTRTIIQQDDHDPSFLIRKRLPSPYVYYPYSEIERPLTSAINAHQANHQYAPNPFVSSSLWLELEPFFLPINHPIKAKLDRIFHKKRVTLSKETFEEAGFGRVRERAPTNIVVGRHRQLKGFIIKAFLDTQPPVGEWGNWISRIAGAHSIQQCIQRHGYKQFRVPRKWIYPLPAHPAPPSNPLYNRKNFILIVEDMHILNQEQNLKAYRKKMTREMLNALYIVLTEEGLIDSVFPDNVPFTEQGQLAFIDTEHHHLWPVRYNKLKPFFSPEMQIYWQKLIDQGGAEEK